MPTEAMPVLEVMVLEASDGLDPSVSLEVTLASLKAAAASGHNLSVTLGFPLDAEAQAECAGLNVRVKPEISAEASTGHLALSRYASERFYMVLTRGQTFPWTVKPHALFRDGRAAFFGLSGSEDFESRVKAAMVSGIATTTAVLPPAKTAIYSAVLADRATIMLASMHGNGHGKWSGPLASEPALYALMNDDRMHTDHFLVERDASPLGNIDKPLRDDSRPYARLTGL